MAPRNSNEARRLLRNLDRAIDLFWVLSFLVGGVVGILSLGLAATVLGTLAAIGITAASAVTLAYIYRRLSKAASDLRQWMVEHNC